MHLPQPFRAAALLLLAAAAGSAGWAQSWDPFPTLPKGTQAAVTPGLDGPEYDPLRQCLGEPRSATGARYYAAVLEISDAGGSTSPEASDAVPYADALYGAWRADLDPQRHVLMVVSLVNRGIAIHPGTHWTNLGFEGAHITSVIDESRFGPFARSGFMADALCALAEDVDAELARLATRAEARDGTSRESASPPQQRRSTGGSGPSLRSLLLVLLFGGGLLAMAAYFFLSRRRRRAKARADEEIERWQGKIGTAAERLLAMENKYPLYFSTRNLRWDGESEDLDQACADAVNRVYLLYSKAFE
ncbi:MAG: hypothetical protein AAGD06_31225, partial [Acidobacteriota bacterium]